MNRNIPRKPHLIQAAPMSRNSRPAAIPEATVIAPTMSQSLKPVSSSPSSCLPIVSLPGGVALGGDGVGQPPRGPAAQRPDRPLERAVPGAGLDLDVSLERPRAHDHAADRPQR